MSAGGEGWMHVLWPWAALERRSPGPPLEGQTIRRPGSSQEWPGIQGSGHLGKSGVINFQGLTGLPRPKQPTKP